MSLLAGLSHADQERVHRADPPRRVEPMPATLTDDHFSDDARIFERKLDGERCIAFRTGDQVRLACAATRA